MNEWFIDQLHTIHLNRLENFNTVDQRVYFQEAKKLIDGRTQILNISY